MQNWNEPETSVIYLANGEQVSANVNGISQTDGSGYVFVHDREIKVMPLPAPWSFCWAEVITVKRNDGSTFETTLTPIQIDEKTAIIDQGDETVYILLDAGVWREMTEQELDGNLTLWLKSCGPHDRKSTESSKLAILSRDHTAPDQRFHHSSL